MAIGERAALAGAEDGPAVVKLGRAGEGAAVWAERPKRAGPASLAGAKAGWVGLGLGTGLGFVRGFGQRQRG